MPKIGTGTNKVSVDPKAYAARITRAKKIVAAMDPATRAKIKDMYPPVKKEAIVNKALSSKATAAKKAAAKPKPNTAKKAPAKPKPMETTRVGGIFSVPKKPKKTIY
jgi:hypothetical protein